MIKIIRETFFTSGDKIVCSVTPESHDQKKRDDNNWGSAQTSYLAL